MRILLITETLHAGGAEIFTLRLCRKLKQLGHSSEVLNLNPDIENQALLQQYPDVTIRRVRTPLLKLVKKLDSLFLKLKLDVSVQNYLARLYIEKYCLGNFEVYHTHLIKVDYLFSLIKQNFPEIKIVSTNHGDYAEFFYKNQAGKPLRWLHFKNKLSLIKQQVDQWIVISDEQLAFFKNQLQVPAQQVLKIYNGFEATDTVKPGSRKDKFIVGMVARGVKLKGWAYLLAAFKNLPENCELRLIGTGEYLDSLRDEHRSDSRIKFMGFHPQPVEEIMQFDVFVLPSLFPHEALPTVIMEALYCGKPIIATNNGEIPQMLLDTETGKQAGFLLDFDGKAVSTEQLTQYLVQYYQQPDLLQQHSLVAKEAFKKFDMVTCAQKHVQTYVNLL